MGIKTKIKKREKDLLLKYAKERGAIGRHLPMKEEEKGQYIIA